MKKLATFFGALIVGLSACGETSFQSGAAQKAPAKSNKQPTKAAGANGLPATNNVPGGSAAMPKPVAGPGNTQTFQLTCAQMSSSSVTPLEVHRKKGEATKLVVQGEVCPQSSNNLTILFVIDWSGSMAEYDGGGYNGCGRVNAGRAIVNAVNSQKQPGDKINVGFIGFADGVDQSASTSFRDISQFSSSLNADNFCRSVEEGTNYIAAFSTAQSWLSQVQGRKVIYFISDGEPNFDANGPDLSDDSAQAIRDSIAAGQRLTTSVDNLVVNGLLLGSAGAEAQRTLVSAIGSADRVRLAAQANDLATEIAKFPNVTLRSDGVSGTLTVGNGMSQVGISSFARGNGTGNIWSFSTKEIQIDPSTTPGITNTRVDIGAQSNEGHAYSTGVSIRIITE